MGAGCLGTPRHLNLGRDASGNPCVVFTRYGSRVSVSYFASAKFERVRPAETIKYARSKSHGGFVVHVDGTDVWFTGGEV